MTGKRCAGSGASGFGRGAAGFGLRASAGGLGLRASEFGVRTRGFSCRSPRSEALFAAPRRTPNSYLPPPDSWRARTSPPDQFFLSQGGAETLQDPSKV